MKKKTIAKILAVSNVPILSWPTYKYGFNFNMLPTHWEEWAATGFIMLNTVIIFLLVYSGKKSTPDIYDVSGMD